MELSILDLSRQVLCTDCHAVTILFLCTINGQLTGTEKSFLAQFQPFFERIILLRLFRRPAVYNVEYSYCYGM